MEAEKSEPPRPSVVGRPSVVALQLEAGDYGNLALQQQGRQAFVGFLLRRLHQRRGVVEDRVGHDDFGRVNRFRGQPAPLQMFREEQRGKPLSHRDRFIHRARRTVPQHLYSVHNAPEIGNDLIELPANARLLGGRHQTRGGFQMPGLQLPQIIVDAGLATAFRVPGCVEQQVGNLRHRGNHCQHGPSCSLDGDQIASRFHALGGTHAGAAEFHHKQVKVSVLCHWRFGSGPASGFLLRLRPA